MLVFHPARHKAAPEGGKRMKGVLQHLALLLGLALAYFASGQLA